MPQPTVFRSIPKSDVQVTRFDAHKTWTTTNSEATASGYIPLNAIFYDSRTPVLGLDVNNNNVLYREDGAPGTEWNKSSKAQWWIKPIDRTISMQIPLPGFGQIPITIPYFNYGLVPYSAPGTSGPNQFGEETGFLDGAFQTPGADISTTRLVPDINYKTSGAGGLANTFIMPPSGSGINKFQYWKFAVWESLNHMFYKRPYDPANCMQSNQTDPNAMYKYLYHSASMVSIPYKYLGEGIKPKSIEISSTRFPFTLTDDKYGNIQIPDSHLNTASFAPNDNLVAYWGFNEIPYQSRYGYHLGKLTWQHDTFAGTTVKIQSGQFTPSFESSASRVAFMPGIKTSGTVKETGYAANFGVYKGHTPEGYPTFIKTNNFIGINPDNDFAWSAWIHAGTDQQTLSPTNTDRDIISKYGIERNYAKIYKGPSYNHFFDDAMSSDPIPFNFPKWQATAQKAFDDAQALDSNYETDFNQLAEYQIERNRYPYRIGIYDQTHASAGHVYVRRSNGTIITDFSSSADLRNTDAHIVLQKTGSMLELWVNGTLDNSGSTAINGCNNNSMLVFGASNASGSNAYSGSLDEVRYYDKALTSTQITSLANNHYLSGSAYQTNVVGNVFRSFGYVVTSSPYWFWNDMFDQKYNWTLKHNSSLEVTEYNVLVNVPQGHFNVSQNPSATQGTNSDLLLGEFTASLSPYVSTIGLYGPEGHLLAVGKLSNAIQKRNDVDMNFVIRWDM